MKRIDCWDLEDELGEHLVGREIVAAEGNTLHLSDGTRLVIDSENSQCCSWVDLTGVHPSGGIITAVTVEDDEYSDRRGENYRAWISVITEAGQFNVAEAEGNESNGYYLHGFALGVNVYGPGEGGND